MKELWRRHALFTAMGAVLLATVPVFLIFGLMDDRLVDGFGVWVKPLKFSVSLGVYVLTLAFFVPWMREGATRTISFRIIAGLLLLAIVYESAWLWSAAALGVRSHYNMDGGLFTLLYPVAGLAAIVLLVPAFAMGVSVLRARRGAVNPALSSAIGWGLILTAVLTMIVAPTLANPMQQGLGGSKDGYGEGFFGWHMVGDLRAAHFFSTHALHVIPVVGFALSRIDRGALGSALARFFAALYAAFVLWLAWGTLQGQPLPEILRQPF